MGRPHQARAPWQGSIALLVAAIALVFAAAPATAQSMAPPGASSCSGCHGSNASGGAVPALQGQEPGGIVAAMQAFRTGRREATVMDRIARGFTDEETHAIAAWVSQQR